MNRLIIVFVCLVILLSLVLLWSYFKEGQVIQKYKELRKIMNNLKMYNKITGSSCKIDYPIFYINMDKHIERRKYMESQLEKISKKFNRIKGFNGYLILDTKEDEIEGVKFRNYYPDMSKAEIGCTISHILAIKKAYDSNENKVIICEDDVMFDTCSLVPNLSVIEDDAPNDWEILQLCVSGTMNGDLRTIYKKLGDFPNIKYYRREHPNNIFWCTACYLINRRGMEKIINTVFKDNTISIIPIRNEFPKHGSADTYLLDIVTTYALVPCLFAVNNTDLESTIHPTHTPTHIEHSLTILSAFKQILNTKQINFAKTLLDMDDILTSNKQKYFLVCGTLLGAIREKKFIEHDDDIDLGIFADEYNQNVEKSILKKFKLKHRYGDIKTGYEISFVHPETNVSLDIFLHYREKDYIWCPSFNNLCNKAKNKMCRWKYYFDNIVTYTFLGKIFNIPSPPEKYLAYAYGNDWMVPQKFSYSEGLEGRYKNLIRDDFGKEGIIPDIPIVWQYWETKPGHNKPGYIELAMNLVQKSCEQDNIKYVKITPENLSEYVNIATLPKNWHNIKQIAHKADYLRAVLLYNYGGLWLDADVIVKNGFEPLIDDLKNADLVVFGDDNDEISIGIIAARKNSPFIKEWLDKMTEKINKNTDFNWTEIGYDILYPMWKKWAKENKGIWRVRKYKDRDTCYPLYWNEWEKFFEKGTCEFLLRSFQPVIMLYNAKFPDWFKKMNFSDTMKYIENSNTVIANLFRRFKP